MDIAEILSTDRIRCAVPVGSKKRALEKVSELVASAQTDLNQGEIFESLLARERLGSTALGHGIALPHGRVEGIDRTVGAFISLSEGVDFDALDGQPVDLLFALIVPPDATEEHLQLLAGLAEMLSDQDLRSALRQARSSEELYSLLNRWESAPSAQTVNNR